MISSSNVPQMALIAFKNHHNYNKNIKNNIALKIILPKVGSNLRLSDHRADAITTQPWQLTER